MCLPALYTPPSTPPFYNTPAIPISVSIYYCDRTTSSVLVPSRRLTPPPASHPTSLFLQWFFSHPLFVLLLFLLVLLLLFPPRLRQPQRRVVFCVTCFSDPVASPLPPPPYFSLSLSLLLNCLTPSLPPTFLLPNCDSAYFFVLSMLLSCLLFFS